MKFTFSKNVLNQFIDDNINAKISPQIKTVVTDTLKQGQQIGNRLLQTGKVASQTALQVAQGEKMSPDLLKQSFEQLGTTYIKIGQFIASSPSVFPRAYVQAFQSCLDQTTPIDFAQVQAVMAQELSCDVTELSQFYQHIDPMPLASASIAQVHAARLHDGTQVVVKVQKPDVHTIMHTDLGILHSISKLMDVLLPEIRYASLEPIIDEIKTRMLAETDFIAEANNLKDFHQFLTDSNNTKVTAPIVIDGLTRKRLLTMTRLQGVSMIDIHAMKAYTNNPQQVMTDTLNTWFASLTQAKSFHADLHAGNLMLLTDGRIGFLDFGIVGQIHARTWQACLGMMNAMQYQDYELMARHMVDMGMTHQAEQVNIKRLAMDLQTLIKAFKAMENAKIKTVNEVNLDSLNEVNRMMLEIAEIGKRHGIRLPRDFALLTKQMLYFDRFMSVLAPNMDIFADSRIHMLGQ